MAKKSNTINQNKVAELLRGGMNGSAVARKLGISPARVSQIKKELGIAVARQMASTDAAEKIVPRNINALEQLQKINDRANEILDLVMAWGRGDGDAIRVLESQIKFITYTDTATGEEKKVGVKEAKMKDPRELALKAMSEIRGQLKLQLEIFQTLYDMQAVEEFKTEVMQVIESVEPELRNEIIRRLAKRRAIYVSAG